MRCSRCGKEMTIKNIQTSTDKSGNPIYHKYALCYNCRIKRDLEKSKRISVSGKKRKNRKRKISLLLTILLLLIAALASGFFFYQKSQSDKAKNKQTVVNDKRKNFITASNYNDLKLGMTLDEVLDMIGAEGSLLTRATVDSAITERYQWITKEENGTVLLTFQDNKLISISQTGMKDDDLSEIPETSLEKVKPGMSLKDVNSAFGSPGIRISETILDGVTTSVYGWGKNGNDYLYSAVFIDGNMQYLNSQHTSSTDTSQQK